jgi:hypothetical protein
MQNIKNLLEIKSIVLVFELYPVQVGYTSLSKEGVTRMHMC